MADCIFSEPYEQINGAIGGDKRYICRKKTHRIFGMKIEGKGEIYKREPRNYKEYPIVGREKEMVDKFRWASQQMGRELADADHFEYWKKRFIRQVEHPNMEILDKNGRPKVYKDFKSYVRAMLIRGKFEIELVAERLAPIPAFPPKGKEIRGGRVEGRRGGKGCALGGWQRSECVTIPPRENFTFNITIEGTVPEGKMILTGNFDEKSWGDSDREMTKTGEGKYTWTGSIPGVGFACKVFVLTEAGEQIWAQERDFAVADDATSPIEATFSFATAE